MNSIDGVVPSRLGVWAIALMVSLALLLGACGGGGGGSKGVEAEEEEEAPDDVAFFFDSAVRGLIYTSGPFSLEEHQEKHDVFNYGGSHFEDWGYAGQTASTGSLLYGADQPTTFYLEGLVLGTVTLGGGSDFGKVITPLDLTGATAANYKDNIRAVNMLRLLQSLDTSGDLGTGIRLRPRFTDAFAQLDLSSDTFEQDVITAIQHDSELSNLYFGLTELVSAEDAVEHFDLTLAGMSYEESRLVGQWGGRDGLWGDYSFHVTFNPDGSGKVIEPGGDCGEGPDAFLVNLESAEGRCSRVERYDIQWTLSSGVLTLKANDFTDTCNIVSQFRESFRAECKVFVGNGQHENETIFFVREADRFEPVLLQGRTFNSYNPGFGSDDNAASIRFEEGGKGHYVNNDDGKVEFDWAVSDNGQTLTLNTDEGVDSEELSIAFSGYLAGAIEESEGGDKSLLIEAPIAIESISPLHRDRLCYDLKTGAVEEVCDEVPTDVPAEDSIDFTFSDGTYRCWAYHSLLAFEVRLHWLGCSPQFGGDEVNHFRYMLLRIGGRR